MCRSGSARCGACNVCSIQVVCKRKKNAYEEAEESIKRAVREAGRPIVKIEIQTKGKW